jgi:hypothetical protein
MTTPEPGTPEYERAFEQRAEEQRRKHEADPEHEPEFLPADEPGFETEAWTAGGPEEEDT